MPAGGRKNTTDQGGGQRTPKSRNFSPCPLQPRTAIKEKKKERVEAKMELNRKEIVRK